MRASHAAELLRMFGEGLELRDDTRAQLLHLLDRLRALVGADVGGELLLAPTNDGALGVARSVDSGWTRASDLARMHRFYEEKGFDANPFSRAVIGAFLRGEPQTMRREDIVDAAAWYRWAFVGEVYEPCRLDHSIYSIRPGATPGTVSALGLSREKGARPFTSE